ncbi:MAG: dephospho-CoA kinase [Spirosomataceae bacterium]
MNPKPPIIGITGGIGSGKSMVCRIFGALGIPVYEADTRAKWLMNHDTLLREQLTALLGAEAYTADGEYNRVWVASQVFGNQELLTKLNTIVHPRVWQDSADWTQAHALAPYLLYEAALMKAAGQGNAFEKVVVVVAPVELRIKRTLARDTQRSEAEVRAIISRQMADEERLKIADYLIQNDDSQLVIPQVLALHEKFLLSKA